MEKLLLVINVQKPGVAFIEFACRLAAITGTKLTGIVVENTYSDPVTVNRDSPPSAQRMAVPWADAETATATDEAIRCFVNVCQKHKIAQEAYVDKGDPLQEILFESRFADLLLLDPDVDFAHHKEQFPSPLVKEVLAKAECPVILVPEKYEGADEIVFCYNGSASSVFAIKQFTYLLPQFRNKKAVLLEVNESGNEEFNESHRRILSWLRAHYLSVVYFDLQGRARDKLFTYLLNKDKRWVVMGAYGRNQLSRLLRKSDADMVIRTIDLPLFITHY